MSMREEILTYMRRQAYSPVTAEELSRVWSEGDREEVARTLEELEREGAVVKTRTERYGVPERMNLKVGKLQVHPKGFAFLLSEVKGEEDVFVAADNRMGAMNGDKVIVRLQAAPLGGGKGEGEVIRILQRAVTQVVGVFEEGEHHHYVSPDDKRIGFDIEIPLNQSLGAKNGQKVVVQLTRYPEGRRSPEGRVTEILGQKGDPGVDILSIVRKYELPEAFPEAVRQAAEAVGPIGEADLAGRRDLRDWDLVTIDGEDAKDLDDAVSLTRLANGHYQLGVHIADVGYYVKEDSPLDREAFRRATSVYLVDRVIPMLPTRLSNDLCSLNPQVDRLAMSCVMEITPQGQVVGREIFPSVICTRERMTYKTVTRILEEGPPDLLERYAPLVPMFREMGELAEILRRRRMERGAIDFDFPESKVVLDERGAPTAIAWYERGIADRIIEEFMLIANETVARYFEEIGIPFVYRVHEEPDQAKVDNLKEFLDSFGLYLKTGRKLHPQAFQRLLQAIAGRPEERAISKVMLRTMQHARYAPEPLGHFGLGARYYCHFTSPIRRYPDLVIHRAIREALAGTMTPERKEKLVARMAEYARQSSEREKVAEEAERESKDLKKVEYMLRHVGETFQGHISGVNAFGFFVELDNSVEGLVHVSYLTDDYYRFLENRWALVGENTRRMYRIGDPVTVRVSRVDLEERRIDFELDEAALEAQPPRLAPAAWLAERGRREESRAGAGARREGPAAARGRREESAAAEGQRKGPSAGPKGGGKQKGMPRVSSMLPGPAAKPGPGGDGKGRSKGRGGRRGANPMEDYGLKNVVTSTKPYFIPSDEG